MPFDMGELDNIKIAGVTLSKVISSLFLLVIAIVIIKLVMKLFDRALSKIKLGKNHHAIIKSLIQFFLYFIAVLIIADNLGIPITSLIALLSVVGLAISLAVQDSLSKIAGGIMILSIKPFVVGDYIETQSASGIVEEIGLIYTKLLSFENHVIYIPNSDVAGGKIVNYSGETSRRVEIKVNIPYEYSTAEVKKAAFEAVASVREVLSEPQPFVNIIEYTESSVKYTIRVWAKVDDNWDVQCSLIERLRDAFDKNGIKMAHNNLNININREKE